MRTSCCTFAYALAALLLVACDAAFVDDRQARPDLRPGPDLVTVGDLPEGETVVGVGTFEGRDGHLGAGQVTLVKQLDESLELRFAAGFSVSDVPAPVVVLSSRDDLGSTIDPDAGDRELGALAASSGAQSYAVAAEVAAGRAHVFVYCKPFGVEVARARLVTP